MPEKTASTVLVLYRERLWPAPWLFFATALVIPASLLVFLPINELVGIVAAIVLYLSCVGLLLSAATPLTVTANELIAGKARLPIELIGVVEGFTGEDARQQRGPRLDARAYLGIRGWIDPVARVELLDARDPAPYWLLSTRRPTAVAEAIDLARNGS